MFRLSGKWKTYFHSLLGLAIGMIIIGFVLNFIRTRGPAVTQGPATTAGNLIFGQRFNF